MLEGCQDEDQRILLKQWLFFKYEKLLRQQQNEAKERRKLQAKAQSDNQVAHQNSINRQESKGDVKLS